MEKALQTVGNQLSIEKVLPYNNNEAKNVQVERMFDNIAGRYDKLNHLMSIGFDIGWRRKTVDALKPYAPKRILDIASGTGDLAIMLQQRLQPECVIGADLSDEMLAIGRAKAGRVGLSEKILFERQDCMSLTYPDASFDAVTAAFGVRNFSNLKRGISEMNRVLKSGGVLAILELSTPLRFPMNQLYKIYSATAIPFLCSLMSLDKSAYKYLPASIKAMPQGSEMAKIIADCGFKNIEIKTFTGGVCSMYMGTKVG